jgi:hypothetical protein
MKRSLFAVAVILLLASFTYSSSLKDSFSSQSHDISTIYNLVILMIQILFPKVSEFRTDLRTFQI